MEHVSPALVLFLKHPTVDPEFMILPHSFCILKGAAEEAVCSSQGNSVQKAHFNTKCTKNLT